MRLNYWADNRTNEETQIFGIKIEENCRTDKEIDEILTISRKIYNTTKKSTHIRGKFRQELKQK